MRRLLLTLTFTESVASILLERGIYFFTDDRLGFGRRENLGLALTMGALYALGAWKSHGLCATRGERPMLSATVAGLMLLHLTMALHPTRFVVWGGFAGIGLLTGMKWPIIESYVTAGMTPKQTLRIVGGFNVTWAAAVPFTLIFVGPMLASPLPQSVIFAAAAIHLSTLVLIRGLPWRPAHLAHDHPERPDPATVSIYRRLLTSSRWSMLGGYAMLFLLAPLMPAIFVDRLGWSLNVAPGLSSIVDIVRLLGFIALGVFTLWRGKAWPLGLSIAGLPAGFLMVLFGHTTAVVVMGQILFGTASAMTYYAALYHAIVLHNASVEAGGQHEGLIGLGLAIGPAVGLVGLSLQQAVGDATLGMLLVVGPLLLLCAVGAARPLWAARTPV